MVTGSKENQLEYIYTCVYGAFDKSTLKQIAPMINAAELFTKNDLFLSKKRKNCQTI